MLPANVTSSGKEFTLRGMSLTYTINKKGSTIHSCGTLMIFNVPHQRKKLWVALGDFISTFCFLAVK
jgi:hypothetical protein